MTERLPTVGSDTDTWGTVLNGFLGVSHNSDGTQANLSVPAAALSSVASGTTATAGYVATADGSGGVSYAAAAGGSADKLGLTPTAVKTSAYTAVAGDFVPVDTTSGAVTITFPAAPADGSVVGIKHVTQGGSNAVGLALGGSDVFNKASGSTTGSLSLLNQGILCQYKATGAIWYVVADDLPLSQLAVDTIGSGSDITTNNASTSKHGLLKKLDNTATHYMDGTGAWSTPNTVVATDTVWDTKGDIVVATGADAAAKLAVSSTQGAVLTVDGSTSSGLAWAKPIRNQLMPSGALAETFDRYYATTSFTTSSGGIRLSAIPLPNNLTITSISFVTGSQGLVRGTGSHLWAALFDSSLNLLRQSTDDTSTAWSANTALAFTLSSTYTTTATGLFYVGVGCVSGSGGTQPNLTAANASSALTALTPILGGNSSSSGLTTTAPNPAGAITAAAALPYAYVS